jgi:hypothetical protein
MKRIYPLLRLASVMLLAVIMVTSCSKSAAGTAPEIRTYPLLSSDSTNIGSIIISEQPGGEARVLVSVNKAILTPYPPPFKAALVNGIPMAQLNNINPETGVSDTHPIVSTNRNLTVSYDLLMYTKALKLVVTDGNDMEIFFTQIH